MMHMFNQDKVQRFSLRKYSIGLASVLLGIFLVGAPSVVYGDESTASDLELVVSDVGESDLRQEIETSEVVNLEEEVKPETEVTTSTEVHLENRQKSADVITGSSTTDSSNSELEDISLKTDQNTVDEEISETHNISNQVNKESVETDIDSSDISRDRGDIFKDEGLLEKSSKVVVENSTIEKGDVNNKEKQNNLSPFRRVATSQFIGDTYSWKYGNIHTDLDRWGYPVRQCTSFVAFRLAETNGFTNVAYLGNGADWGKNAWSRGGYVDSKPAVGAVAWFGAGSFGASDLYGHVAWVAAVEGDTVIIEEYNYNWSYGYNRRPISAASVTGYIHFKDLQTPNSSVTSPIVSTPGTLAPSGSYYFTKRAAIKNEPKISAVDMAYYESGMSVNYDKVLEADGYRWLSYLSFQGNRRYIPIEKLNASNSSVTPIVEKPRLDLPPSGTYTFSKLSFIKNEPRVSATTIATYGVGVSVNYDRLVDSDGKTWLSYISNSGVRRYIAIT